MGVVKKISDYRPPQEVVERRVAELEDGYTRLANALYDELIGADLTKNQSKVAHAICRKTYGFGKKMDRISDSQLAQLTRLPRQKVNKAKNELIAMKVILRDGSAIGPNKNISEWEIEGCHYSGDNVTTLVTKSVTKTVTGLSPKQSHTKETIQKKKENTPIPPQGAVRSSRQTIQFDRERVKSTWNSKAETYGLPKIRSITSTVEKGLTNLYKAHLKQCKETGREPRDVDTLINGYLEFGYQPTRWAMGDNPEGKKYGIETALRQQKIDEILGQEA